MNTLDLEVVIMIYHLKNFLIIVRFPKIILFRLYECRLVITVYEFVFIVLLFFWKDEWEWVKPLPFNYYIRRLFVS
jgi:hypothetical protein